MCIIVLVGIIFWMGQNVCQCDVNIVIKKRIAWEVLNSIYYSWEGHRKYIFGV